MGKLAKMDESTQYLTPEFANPYLDTYLKILAKTSCKIGLNFGLNRCKFSNAHCENKRPC